MFNFLKKVPLFANLPDDDLWSLCDKVTEEHISKGEIFITEGETGDKAYVILSGEVEIFKKSGERNVLVATRHTGDVIGEMSLLEQNPRFASGMAKSDSDLLVISHKSLNHLLDTSPSAARVMLSTIMNRLRNSELVLRQSEKMAQIGILTAGIAHELNNPAAAARRSSEHLRTSIEKFQQIYQKINSIGFSSEQWLKTSQLQELAKNRASHPVDLDGLGRSDREEEIEKWFVDNGIENGWDYAPVLVSLEFQPDSLDELKREFSNGRFLLVIQWLCALFTIFGLLQEIYEGTARIGEIVHSLKSYVYLDQAPVQSIDVNEGLDNTLVILRSKLKKGIVLERHYQENLPKILGYGSELNQVWTNIIDNAIDAMGGKGSMTITTKLKDDWVVVDIEDSGPGIPENIREKLFSPFFTTKPMGKGTGLGLNISFNIIQKHKGDIKVFSQPGRTCFSVRIPVNFENVDRVYESIKENPQITDDQIKALLISVKTIAVLGISNQNNTAAYSESVYLKNQGYRFFPVNPELENYLGEKSYPDLPSLNGMCDMVLIFGRIDNLAEIISQAIGIGSKIVWTQENYNDQNIIKIVKDANLDFVTGISLQQTHRRLMKVV